jgi:hypothetical protein
MMMGMLVGRAWTINGEEKVFEEHVISRVVEPRQGIWEEGSS